MNSENPAVTVGIIAIMLLVFVLMIKHSSPQQVQELDQSSLTQITAPAVSK